MKTTIKSILILVVFVVGFNIVAARADTCDQGAPGRQGPWPVYIVQPTQLVSASNVTTTVTPTPLAAHTEFTQTITQSGAIVGQVCGVSTPAGFDTTTFIASCTASGGTVVLSIYNTSAGTATATAGDYTTVTF